MIIPEYIEIRTAAGQLAAVLSPEADGLKDCWIDTRLNAECSLTFLLPMTSDKWSELTAECRIRAGGREFVILRPDAIDTDRDKQGKVWGKVMAAESWALLNKQYPTIPIGSEDLTVTVLSSDLGQGGYLAGSAGSALTRLLSGSGWTVGTVDVTGTHDLETEKLSLLENIQEVQKIWGGLLVWDSISKTLSLRSESLWQNYTGFQVRYAKNLQGITRTANYDLITKLYPFGENDLDISSVNGGVKYLENNSYTASVYVGIYQDQDIDDAQELMDKATEALDKLSQPRYTYRVKLLDQRTLPQYAHEDFALGDIVDVIDEDLSIDIQARVMRYKYNVFQPWQCELEIGEPEDRLVAKLAQSFDVAKFVREALRPNPATRNILKGFLDTYSTEVLGANGDYSTVDGVSTWQERVGGVLTGKMVRVSPGGIIISSDGGENWDTAITGEGIASGVLVGGTIVAADAIYLGDSTFSLEAANRRILITDTQPVPKSRVILGKNGANPEDYGLWIYDSAGGLILGASGLGVDVVGTDQIINGSITDAKIDSLSANKITAGTIDASEIDVINLDADNIVAGSISADRIGAGTISATISIEGPTITGGTIKTNVTGQPRVELGNGFTLADIDLYHNNTHGLQIRDNITSFQIWSPSGALPIYLGGAANTIYPEGTWNFTGATVSNLSVSYADEAGDASTLQGSGPGDFATAGHDHNIQYVRNAGGDEYRIQEYPSGYIEFIKNGVSIGTVQLS